MQWAGHHGLGWDSCLVWPGDVETVQPCLARRSLEQLGRVWLHLSPGWEPASCSGMPGSLPGSQARAAGTLVPRAACSRPDSPHTEVLEPSATVET